MGFEKYETIAGYTAAGLPTTTSRISLVEEDDSVHFDGVNVKTTTPVVGDVVFIDDENHVVYLKGGDQLIPSLIPSNWTHVGYVYMRKGRKAGIIDKNVSSLKYADVVQHSITEITSTSITINLRMSNDFTTDTSVPVTLSSTNIDNITASEINTAIQNKATEVGDTGGWWAYLADADDNKVESGGTKIIVQRDVWQDYRQYNSSMTGGTISFTTWGTMPASSVYWKVNGKSANTIGIMNIARGATYYGTNGRTPTANEGLGMSGNTAPVNRNAFLNSEYCSALRAEYSTYENYIYGEFKVMYPQAYGTFSMPEPDVLAQQYADAVAITKTGTFKYKFPVLHYGYNIQYSATGVRLHDWHLPSSLEGCYLMDDDTLSKLAPSVTKMNTTTITNSVGRWFAERCSFYNARFFSGNYGYLITNYVPASGRCQSVTLLDL